MIHSFSDEHYYTSEPESKAKLGLIRANLRGHFFEFLTSSSVFSKKRVDLGTRVMIESMVLPERGYALDLGCGYGPIGIAAAVLKPNLNVVMVDVNKRAVRLARENAKRNNASNVKARHGSFYEPIRGMRFDTILSNPPTSAGRPVVMSIVRAAPEHLREKGLLQLVVRSRIGGKRLHEDMERTFGNVEVLARKSGYRVLLSKNLKASEHLSSQSS